MSSPFEKAVSVREHLANHLAQPNLYTYHELTDQLIDLSLYQDEWSQEIRETAEKVIDRLLRILPNMSAEGHASIIMATTFGWTCLISDADAAKLISPDGRHHRTLLLRKPSPKEDRRLRDFIYKYADPDLLARAAAYPPSVYAGIALGAGERIQYEEVVQFEPVHCGKPQGHEPHRYHYLCRFPRRADSERLNVDFTEEEIAQEIAHCSGRVQDYVRPPTLTSEPEATMEAPTLVSSRPWMAHQSTTNGRAKAYPTRNTIERSWSDGTTDYICAYDGCDSGPDGGPFWSATPRNVVTHFAAKHVRWGDLPVQDKPEQLVDDPNFEGTGLTRKVRPRKSRIDALARFLSGLNLKDMSEEDIAEQSLTFLAELSNAGSPDSQEREPLTPEQIITRIRTLVDTGTFMEQQSVLDERELRIMELEDELRIEHEKRANLEGNLSALRDIVRDILPADSIGKG